MALLNKDDPDETQNKGPVVGFTKPKKFLFFKQRAKPIYASDQAAGQSQAAAQQAQPRQPIFNTTAPQPTAQAGAEAKPKGMSSFRFFITNTAARKRGLELALKAQGIKSTPYEFVRRMFFSAVIVAAVVAIALGVLFYDIGITPILAIIIGIALYYGLFYNFLDFPIARGRSTAREVERDILYAARDLVIGMRSGMPLFNALTTVSKGYGAASREFGKVVQLIELGMPIEQAIDEVSGQSSSRTFKMLMLQASVSIRAGADVVGALQSVVDEVTQERIIELRRYGQRLNALAMFYMLFGVIFPSMGIAVAAILTTFISLFTVNETTLAFALVGIIFVQVIFLNLMRTSRPSFAV